MLDGASKMAYLALACVQTMMGKGGESSYVRDKEYEETDVVLSRSDVEIFFEAVETRISNGSLIDKAAKKGVSDERDTQH
jgi:hypothetical protein